jgi:arsenate reductase
MAEGLMRHLAGGRFEAFSAGTEATAVRPLAIRAMSELGIDISQHESTTLDRYIDQPFDPVITVCDNANESCPVFPNARTRLHWSMPDPSKAGGTEAEQFARLPERWGSAAQAHRSGATSPSRLSGAGTTRHGGRDRLFFAWKRRTSHVVGRLPRR